MNARLAYNPDEAAYIAGVGRTLIFAEIKKGTLRAHKAGARTLITAEDLKKWIRNLPARS